MALKRGLEHLSGLDLAVKVEALPFSVFQLEIFAAIAALLLWSAGLCVYRLYLSPLAKFPGDRLAAISGWVETYYDVFQGGQLIFKLADWHAKYGEPLVISKHVCYEFESILTVHLRPHCAYKPVGGPYCRPRIHQDSACGQLSLRQED